MFFKKNLPSLKHTESFVVNNVIKVEFCHFKTTLFFQCRLEEYHDIAMSLCGELKNGKVPLGELIFSCINNYNLYQFLFAMLTGIIIL